MLAGRRQPLRVASQHAGAKVQCPLVAAQLPEADIEGLVIDQQPDDLAIGDVDHDLPRLGVAVAGLDVGQRARFVETV